MVVAVDQVMLEDTKMGQYRDRRGLAEMVLLSQDSPHQFLLLQFLHLLELLGLMLLVHKDTLLVVVEEETKMVDLLTQVVEVVVEMEEYLMQERVLTILEVVEVDLLVVVVQQLAEVLELLSL